MVNTHFKEFVLDIVYTPIFDGPYMVHQFIFIDTVQADIEVCGFKYNPKTKGQGVQ